MRSLAHSSWGRSERGRSDHVQGWATVTSTVAVSHSAGSQIRRFTVEYPSSTSFFKLSTMAGSRSIKGLRARLALGVPHGRIQSGTALRIAIEEATKVEVEDQTPDVKDMKVAKPKA